MADNLTPFDPASTTAPQPGIRGFLNSRTGKLIVGGAALVLVLGVLGVISLGFLGSSDAEQAAVPSNGGITLTKPQPTEVVAVKVPDDVELDDVFTYRDVFVPTVTLVSSSTTVTTTSNSTTTNTSNSTSTTNDSATNTPANTLVLEDISTEDGQPVAVLSWNGQTYTLAEGEEIPNTPWQVLEINSSTVVMLYGDARITLSVGVGISK